MQKKSFALHGPFRHFVNYICGNSIHRFHISECHTNLQKSFQILFCEDVHSGFLLISFLLQVLKNRLGLHYSAACHRIQHQTTSTQCEVSNDSCLTFNVLCPCGWQACVSFFVRVCVCVCVCVYVCVHACVCVSAFMGALVRGCVRVNVCLCLSVSLWICLYDIEGSGEWDENTFMERKMLAYVLCTQALLQSDTVWIVPIFHCTPALNWTQCTVHSALCTQLKCSDVFMLHCSLPKLSIYVSIFWINSFLSQ